MAETMKIIVTKEIKGETTKHTKFLSISNVDFQIDDGRDDDAAACNDEDADDFVNIDSDSAVVVASAPDDDIEEDGNGDGESNDNGDDDDDCK